MALDDSYSKVLLHMDGADASQTFTDESGKKWTTNGNAQIDTAQSVFGGASGLFDGNGDYITTPDHDDFSLGSGDFTIDCRIRPAAINTRMYVIAQINSGGTASTQAFEIAIALGPGGANLIYVSTTVGTLTQTKPTGEDDVVQAVGWALSADVIFFCPSMMWITHTA